MDDSYFVHSSSFVDEPVKIGRGTKIWHFSHVMKNCEIGEFCNLGQNVNIGENVKIGSFCKIQNNVSVYGGVVLEDYVFCGPSMVFTNDLNPRCEFPKNGHYVKTWVKTGATIGANATIVCGCTIGKYAMIGAGSVVTRDVGDYELVVGNPSHRIGYVCRCGNKLNFTDDFARCSCGKTYQIKNSCVEEQK